MSMRVLSARDLHSQNKPKAPMSSISSCVCVMTWPCLVWWATVLSHTYPSCHFRTRGHHLTHNIANDDKARIATDVEVMLNATVEPVNCYYLPTDTS